MMRIPQEPPPDWRFALNAQQSNLHRGQQNIESSAEHSPNAANHPTLGSPFQSPFGVTVNRPESQTLTSQTSSTETPSPVPQNTFTQTPPQSSNLPLQSLDATGKPTSQANSMTSSRLYNATPRPSISPDQTAAAGTDNDTDGSGTDTYKTYCETSITQETLGLPAVQHLSLENDADLYDITEEPLPRQPFFDHAFQGALKGATRLAGEVATSLNGCALAQDTASDLSKLLRTARKHENFDSPEQRTIGIIGDSASGKSSLINSLLHVPNLAHKGDFGRAVTSFVTEYRRRTPLHTAPFTIEVEYSSQVEIHEQLRELLFAYQELWAPWVARLAESENDTETDEYNAIETRSSAALDTLRNIFPDVEEVNPEYLKDRTEGAFDRILQVLLGYARRLRWPAGAQDGQWSTTAKDAENCQQQVDIFMENGLWPLINVVRIYLSAQVLKTGVLLADLPGFRDINLARVKKTQQYLARCNEVFVVANVTRVVTDKSVRDTLRSLLRSNAEKQKGIAIVCTHADIIDLSSAEKEYKVVAQSPTTVAARRARDAAYKKSSAEYEHATLRYTQIFATARNNEATAELSVMYPQLESANHSNIFCVGNRDYEGYLYRSNKAKNLAIRGSGIPILRRFCHSIVAKAQFKAANHFLSVDIPSFIQSIEVWLDASKKITLPTGSLDFVKDTQKDLESRVDQCRSTLETELSLRLFGNLSGSDEKRLSDNAIITSRSWVVSQYHHTQYKAWARNNGDWYTEKCGEKNWNMELLYEMNKNLPQNWHELGQALETQLTLFQKALHSHYQTLRGKMQAARLPQALLFAVDFKERELAFAVSQEADSLRRKAGMVRYNSTGTHISSFTLEYMIPVYRAMTAESGTGIKRMHSIMETEMQKRRLFPHIRERIREEMLQSFNSTAYTLTCHVAQMCKSLEEQLGTYKRAEMAGPNMNQEDVGKVRRALGAAREGFGAVEALAMQAREMARALGYI